jgi:hypothetical protein
MQVQAPEAALPSLANSHHALGRPASIQDDKGDPGRKRSFILFCRRIFRNRNSFILLNYSKYSHEHCGNISRDLISHTLLDDCRITLEKIRAGQ